MTTTSQLVFALAVSFLLVHELDAIRHHEWRFFFAPVGVDDGTAYRLFAALHAPLFVGVLWFVASPAVQVGVDGLLVVHGFLHLVLRDHPRLEFAGWFSWLWIVGGAALGAVHLLLVL